MTAVPPADVPAPAVRWFPRLAGYLCWLVAVVLAGASAQAQPPGNPAIGLDWSVSPAELGPGSAFTLDGTVTIDPDHASIDTGNGNDTIAWTVTIGPVSDVTIETATCGATAGTSCEAEIDGEEETVTWAGVVAANPEGEVTAEIVFEGSISDQLDRDTILFSGGTCATVEVISGTPAAGRLPLAATTPDNRCDGEAGTVEVTVVPATEVPTEVSTEAPTATPTVRPTATSTLVATPEPTATPTVEPTESPAATPTPTAAPPATVAPTATPVPTGEPTSTIVPTATATATPTPTTESTATTSPTTEPSATPVPTQAPTPTPVPTRDPITAQPTEAPAATLEPTPEATTPATEAPQPTPVDDDGDTTGLWIGGGALLILATAAGVVLYQRRKLGA